MILSFVYLIARYLNIVSLRWRNRMLFFNESLYSRSFWVSRLTGDPCSLLQQKYLTDYGYLPHSDLSDGSAGNLRTEHQLRDAIRNLQVKKFISNPWGYTLSKLQWPRCHWEFQCRGTGHSVKFTWFPVNFHWFPVEFHWISRDSTEFSSGTRVTGNQWPSTGSCQECSCHKRQKPLAPIRNRQTRKVANAKVLNCSTKLTKPNLT